MKCQCYGKGESGRRLERKGRAGDKRLYWMTAVSLGVFPQGTYNIHSTVTVHTNKGGYIIVPVVPNG